MKPYISLFVLSALVSCAPAPEIKKRAPLFTTEEKLEATVEKMDKSIITKKFNDSIFLKCDFIIDNHEGTTVSILNSYGFSINLAKHERPINLSMKFGDQSFVVGMLIKKFEIRPENKVPLKNGAIEVMRNSPVVTLLIRGREIQGKLDQKYDRTEVINEKGTLTITDLFPAKYPHILNCDLRTEVSNDYSDDYVTIDPAAIKEPETDLTPSPEGVSEAIPTPEASVPTH